MGIAVNGVDINDSVIEAEIGHHQQARNPLREAVHEVVLRRVLLDEAARLEISGDSDDDRIEALFAREVTVPEADEEACLRYYLGQADRFRSGDLVEARHILLQVTPSAPLDLLRQTAEAILAELQAQPERFAESGTLATVCDTTDKACTIGTPLRLDSAKLRAKRAMVAFSSATVTLVRKRFNVGVGME